MTNIHVKYTISEPVSKLRETNGVYRQRQILNKIMLALSMVIFGPIFQVG